MSKRRNAVEPPKSSEARWYLQGLESGQITPATVERLIQDVKVALDDARYFEKPHDEIKKIEARLADLEVVLVWDQAASVERGLAAAAEKPEPKAVKPGASALPVRTSVAEEVATIDVPNKTHDGFPLSREDREEIANLLRLARDGRISKSSIVEARNEVEDRIRVEKDKEQLQALRGRYTVLDEVLHLGKFKLRNPREKKPIISKGWDGLYALVDVKGRPVSEGQKVKDYVIVGGRAPHKPDSSGRIWVPAEDPMDRDDVREFFPTNVGLKWIHERDWKRNPKQNPYVMNVYCSACGEGSAALTKEAMKRILGKPCSMCGGKMISVAGQGGVPATFPPTMPKGWLSKPVSGHGLQNKPRRKNSDEELRRLERDAKAGDKSALRRLEGMVVTGRSVEARRAWQRVIDGMRRGRIRREIVKAMARSLFVDAWDDAECEAGREHHGELMDLAPETIPEAIEAAEDLAEKFETLNKKALDVMFEEAAAVDGHRVFPIPEDFGHYTAMQALGHGVSWRDDHPDHGFRVPHFDYVVTPGDYGEEESELCEGCGTVLEQPGEDGFDEGDYCERCRRSLGSDS
jgi:hypothetical protein